MKDRLYILRAPFEDAGRSWYCNDCATLEGALLVNPHWNETIDVCRMEFPRPRKELAALVGEGHQGCPVLVMDAKSAPRHAMQVGAYAIVTDVREIGRTLVARHGGVEPHP